MHEKSRTRAGAQEQHGKSPADAHVQRCLRIRFRRIMMTTFGAAPIALGFGAGGEARRPLGLAVVGGLIVWRAITALPERRWSTPTWPLSRRVSQSASTARPLPHRDDQREILEPQSLHLLERHPPPQLSHRSNIDDVRLAGRVVRRQDRPPRAPSPRPTTDFSSPSVWG